MEEREAAREWPGTLGVRSWRVNRRGGAGPRFAMFVGSYFFLSFARFTRMTASEAVAETPESVIR